MSYVELSARSNFSFLRGASSPQALIGRGAELGYDAMALTDCDGLYGMVRAHEAARERGVRLIVGCELTVRTAPPHATVTLLVEDHTGYTNLCRILTESHRLHPKGPRKKCEGAPRNLYAGVPVSFVCAHASGLWALAHVGDNPAEGITALRDSELASLREAFGERASVAMHRHLDGEDRARTRAVLRASHDHDLPVCATNAVRYARREEKPIYDVLQCIREGITLDAAGRRLAPNAEACLKSPAAMARVFKDRPEWIQRSREIADACQFSLRELKYHFPSELDEPAFPGETPDQALRRLSYAGAHERYGERIPEKVAQQIEKELDLIEKLGVAPYFLSVRSIVEIARSKNILCQGRGSAANSAVCYVLGITAVDPERSELLFERFLSYERKGEPPDIDVDFEHERREEVIQELYRRYTRERAAMVSEVISYRSKSALRDVGKVFGLSLEQVERLSGLMAWWDSVSELEQRLTRAGFDPQDQRVRQVLTYARAIQGFPRHLSIHVGGFVLSSTPLVEVAPIEPATMKDRTVIPWDKDDLDALGFFKVDVLGLGMLTVLRKTLALAQEDDPRIRGETPNDQLRKIPKEDPAVYEALGRADTVGVFQIESRAQMAMLPRLKPKKFYDLVVEVAIVRPGPIQGGMIHPYLRRRNQEEPSDPPHPSLAPILERTLGVPLFQEQVMQIAIVGAGYTGGEADQLRRDMAAWRKNGKLERHRERLMAGFEKNGIPREFAERLYKQIQGFGEYGFPESHASSFALLVYDSAWLKVFHPAAFAAGLINSQPMGFYSPNTILMDAKRHGVEVRPIRVERSSWDCTLERDGGKGPALRVGLRVVKGLNEQLGARIEQERARRPFTSVEDLVARTKLNKAQLRALAEAGALDDLAGQGGPSLSGRSTQKRRRALWKVHEPRGEGLLAGKKLVDLPSELPPMTRMEQLVLDYERTGISIHEHPMLLARTVLPKRIKSSQELSAFRQGARVSVAGMVVCRQRPQTASGIVFMTLEDEFGFINLVLYTDVFERFRDIATGAPLVIAHGKIERSGGKEGPIAVIYVVVERLERLELPGGLPGMSRDFH